MLNVSGFCRCRNAEKVRKLHIEKSSYPLGIQISQGSSGGIFVTTVTEGSIAQKAGLRYGDQILEVPYFSSSAANCKRKYIKVYFKTSETVEPDKTLSVEIFLTSCSEIHSVMLHNQSFKRPGKF